MPAEAFASEDNALIFSPSRAARAQHGRKVAQRFGKIAAGLGLNNQNDVEEVHFRQRHALI